MINLIELRHCEQVPRSGTQRGNPAAASIDAIGFLATLRIADAILVRNDENYLQVSEY